MINEGGITPVELLFNGWDDRAIQVNPTIDELILKFNERGASKYKQLAYSPTVQRHTIAPIRIHSSLFELPFDVQKELIFHETLHSFGLTHQNDGQLMQDIITSCGFSGKYSNDPWHRPGADTNPEGNHDNVLQPWERMEWWTRMRQRNSGG